MSFAKIRRHLGRLGRFLRMPLAHKWLVLQAFVLLGVSRRQIKRHGLKAVEHHLGERMIESSTEMTESQASDAQHIGWAVNAVRIYTPWTSNCFPQAVATQRLLYRRGIPATVYLGATLDSDINAAPRPDFAAHAWVRCGGSFITGGDGVDRYRAIVWFSNSTTHG